MKTYNIELLLILLLTSFKCFSEQTPPTEAPPAGTLKYQQCPSKKIETPSTFMSFGMSYISDGILPNYDDINSFFWHEQQTNEPENTKIFPIYCNEEVCSLTIPWDETLESSTTAELHSDTENLYRININDYVVRNNSANSTSATPEKNTIVREIFFKLVYDTTSERIEYGLQEFFNLKKPQFFHRITKIPAKVARGIGLEYTLYDRKDNGQQKAVINELALSSVSNGVYYITSHYFKSKESGIVIGLLAETLSYVCLSHNTTENEHLRPVAASTGSIGNKYIASQVVKPYLEKTLLTVPANHLALSSLPYSLSYKGHIYTKLNLILSKAIVYPAAGVLMDIAGGEKNSTQIYEAYQDRLWKFGLQAISDISIEGTLGYAVFYCTGYNPTSIKYLLITSGLLVPKLFMIQLFYHQDLKTALNETSLFITDKENQKDLLISHVLGESLASIALPFLWKKAIVPIGTATFRAAISLGTLLIQHPSATINVCSAIPLVVQGAHYYLGDTTTPSSTPNELKEQGYWERILWHPITGIFIFGLRLTTMIPRTKI